MSGKRTSVASRLSIILAASLTVLLLGASWGLSQYLSNKLEEKSLEALRTNNRMIIDMIDAYNAGLTETVQRLGKVFASHYPETFSQDAASGVLRHGGTTISERDTSIPDRFTSVAGLPATVLTRQGDDFVRTSTSVTNEKGERATGIPLGAGHPAVRPLLRGEPYTGKAKMLGRDFMTHYIPIRDSAGQVIGAFFVGLDFTEGLVALKKRVLAVKIGKTGYPYALDAGVDRGRLVIHPAAEGSSLLETRDAHGREFIREMLDKGDGTTTYDWRNPNETEAREKVVVYNRYEPWNWMIASGSYLDEFNSEGKEAGRGLMLVALISIPVVFFIVWVATRRWIARPLDEAVALASRVAGGDFTTHIESRTHDEIGQLMRALADMVGKLGRTIAEVRHAATAVAGDATQLRESSDSVAQGSNQQSDAASGMAAAVEQMTASIGMIVEHAEQAHAISQESQEVSRESSATIQSAVAAMTHIAETVRQASEAIEQLGRESEEISNIVRVIKDIADQTNLLALNAAIEAARAGEAGRGFAVVADEVRKLAERTAKSTHEISDMIGRIQHGTQNAVRNMNLGVEQVAEGVRVAAEADQAIERIREGSTRVSNAVTTISEAIREQNAASASIAQGLERIADMTERNTREAEQSARAAEELSTVATQLRGTVEQFRVSTA